MQESGANREKQEKLLREIEMRRRVRAITVPVIDKEVRERLRSMGEPVTLFGEREVCPPRLAVRADLRPLSR